MAAPSINTFPADVKVSIVSEKPSLPAQEVTSPPKHGAAPWFLKLSSRNTQSLLIDTILSLCVYSFWAVLRLDSFASATRLHLVCTFLSQGSDSKSAAATKDVSVQAIQELCLQAKSTYSQGTTIGDSAVSFAPGAELRYLVLIFILVKLILSYKFLSESLFSHSSSPFAPVLPTCNNDEEVLDELCPISRPFDFVIGSIAFHTTLVFLLFGVWPQFASLQSMQNVGNAVSQFDWKTIVGSKSFGYGLIACWIGLACVKVYHLRQEKSANRAGQINL